MNTFPFLFICIAPGLVKPSQIFETGHQPTAYRNDSVSQVMFIVEKGFALFGHHLMTLYSSDPYECMITCVANSECKSANFLTAADERHACELNTQTKGTRPLCFVKSDKHTHLSPANDVTLDHCLPNPCVNGGTCTSTCQGPGYKCNCKQYNTGQRCEQWTVAVASCKDIYTNTSHRQDMAYIFDVESVSQKVYCHLNDLPGCGLGGWTLIMKMDGRKRTFHYSSAKWTNKENYNPSAGQTGFDKQETKLSTYWGVSFTKLCLGMRWGGTLNWIRLTYSGSSLHALIADGTYRPTSLGKSTWKSLITGGSLQSNCNKQGFNVRTNNGDGSSARIGIVTNNENNCLTCDSKLGFGTANGGDDNNTVGNRCHTYNCNPGDRNRKAFGYILVQ